MYLKKALTVLIICIISMNMKAQTNDHVLKVQGMAEVKAVPAVMIINIPLQAKDPDYEKCTNKLTSVFNSLTAALLKTGIDKKSIKSGQLNISEDYKYMDRDRVLIGYIGNITVEIEMENNPKNLQNVMKTLNDERFKFGYNVGFKLSESQKDSLRAEAIKAAVSDAKQKAKTLAEALEVSLGKILVINFEYEDGGNQPLMMEKNMRYAMTSDSGGESIELNPKEISITKSVGVVWLLEQ